MFAPLVTKGIIVLLAGMLAFSGLATYVDTDTTILQGTYGPNMYYVAKVKKKPSPKNLGGGYISQVIIKENGEVVFDFGNGKVNRPTKQEQAKKPQPMDQSSRVWKLLYEIDKKVAGWQKGSGKSTIYPWNKGR